MLVLYSVYSTFFMTVFSYICGYITGHQFREPELLNQLVKTSVIPLKPNKKNILGWMIHLGFGVIFGVILKLSWSYFNFSSIIGFSIIAGIIAGMMGVLGWQVMFRLNPRPPKIQLRKFYLQLVIAHIIFTFTFISFLS